MKRHNEENSVSQIRICEDHYDYIRQLLGRAEELRLRTYENLGICVDLDFILFNRTGRQKEVIIQLEQAADLIGLSVCIEGNINQREMRAQDGTKKKNTAANESLRAYLRS